MPRKPRTPETAEQVAYMARREHQHVLAGAFGELSVMLAQHGIADSLDHPNMQPLVQAVGKALDTGIEMPPAAEREA